MPGPQLKQNRQDRLINELYDLYDAVHRIDNLTEITIHVREIITMNLQRQIEILKSELANSRSNADEDGDESDITSVFGGFISGTC